MSGRIAVAVCAHYKPWLLQSTLLTLLAQQQDDWDLFLLTHEVDRTAKLGGPFEKYRTLSQREKNPQYETFDPRVRDVARLRDRPVREIRFENDHSLDSGAWYKFLRTGAWRDYDYTLFMGEGTLLARPSSFDDVVSFARARGADFIASGHEKRRLPRNVVLQANRRGPTPSPMDAFHDEMIQSTFDVFRRDPDFATVFDEWGSDFEGETQNHVPDIGPKNSLVRRLRNRANRVGHGHLRRLLYKWDAQRSAFSMAVRAPLTVGGNGTGTHVRAGSRGGGQNPIAHGKSRFYLESRPEWFGCSVIHLHSRRFLETLNGRMQRFGLYDAIDLPFAATALEPIWGLMPAWLGFEKWFTDSFHRPRKNFVTSRREDDPGGMANYINRYFRGRLHVVPRGDFLSVKGVSEVHEGMLRALPAIYFGAEQAA